MSPRSERITNWICGASCESASGRWLQKFDPHSGLKLSEVADSSVQDVQDAVLAASAAFPAWSTTTPVQRGQLLSALVALLRQRSDELAACIAIETGKPAADAKAEVNAAIMQGEYFAGEGLRLHGRSLTSSMAGKSSFTVRQPHGVAALIVPANTPIANIAWKVFPALICGNTVVLKASEDAPHIAGKFAELTKEACIPDGVFNVVQGGGATGAALVENPQVALISFTGSTRVGRWIAEVGGRRLARVSLELGGKNALVVCDDADIEQAVHWASLSAFSNAGQRCAAGSRLLIFCNVYDEFKDRLVAKARGLRLGTAAGCDLGPVINRRQHEHILSVLAAAKARGAGIACGGGAPDDAELRNGFYVQPTLIEEGDPQAELNRRELFGPVATLVPVQNLNEAIKVANDTEYGLTAAIHTRSIDRALWFAHRVRTGVANINLGTFGSEPHMPFGGFGASGNGTREPGLEALDVYSELKNISVLVRSSQL